MDSDLNFTNESKSKSLSPHHSSSTNGTTPHSLRSGKKLTRTKGQIKSITDTHKYYIAVQYTQENHAIKALIDVLEKVDDIWTFGNKRFVSYIDFKHKKLLIIVSSVKSEEKTLHIVYNVCIPFGPIVQIGTEETFGTKKAMLIKKRKKVNKSKDLFFPSDLSSIKIILYEVTIRLDNDSIFSLGHVSKSFHSSVCNFIFSQTFWKEKLKWLYQTKEEFLLYEVNWMIAFNIFDTFTPNEALHSYIHNYEIFRIALHLGANIYVQHDKKLLHLKKLVLRSVAENSPLVLEYLLRIYVEETKAFTMKLLKKLIYNMHKQKFIGKCECIDVGFKMYKEINYPYSDKSYSELLSPEEQVDILSVRNCHFNLDWDAIFIINHLIDVIKIDPFTCNNSFLRILLENNTLESDFMIKKLLLDTRIDLSLDNYVVIRNARGDHLALILQLCKLDITKINFTEHISTSPFLITSIVDKESNDFLLLLSLNVKRRIDLSKYVDKVSYQNTNPYVSKYKHELNIKQLIDIDPFFSRHIQTLAKEDLTTIHASLVKDKKS